MISAISAEGCTCVANAVSYIGLRCVDKRIEEAREKFRQGLRDMKNKKNPN